jgi:CBS-domain-containing membrane protein
MVLTLIHSNAKLIKVKELNSVASVRERTILTERPPLVNEVSTNFADRECHLVSVTDSYGRILGFLDRTKLKWPD